VINLCNYVHTRDGRDWWKVPECEGFDWTQRGDKKVVGDLKHPRLEGGSELK